MRLSALDIVEARYHAVGSCGSIVRDLELVAKFVLILILKLIVHVPVDVGALALALALALACPHQRRAASLLAIKESGHISHERCVLGLLDW